VAICCIIALEVSLITDLPTAVTNPTLPTTPGISRKKPLLVTAMVLVLLGSGFFVLNSRKEQPAPSTLNVYTSDQDTRAQETIKELTGYDWSNVPENLGSSEKQLLSGLLLLYNEQSSVFRTEIPTISLNRVEAENLKLETIPTDVSKENVAKLFDMLIKVETSYRDEGLVPASAHLERLQYLQGYFEKHTPSEKNKIPEDAKKISSDLVIADNHSAYMKAILERYNNWLEFVNSQ
jgi:hypothetical protein